MYFHCHAEGKILSYKPIIVVNSVRTHTHEPYLFLRHNKTRYIKHNELLFRLIVLYLVLEYQASILSHSRLSRLISTFEVMGRTRFLTLAPSIKSCQTAFPCKNKIINDYSKHVDQQPKSTAEG